MRYQTVVRFKTWEENQYTVEAENREDAAALALRRAKNDGTWGEHRNDEFECTAVWEDPPKPGIPPDIKNKISSDEENLSAEISEALDELVHETKGNEAANINNEGTDSQLRYLRNQGVSWNEIREALGLPKIEGGK